MVPTPFNEQEEEERKGTRGALIAGLLFIFFLWSAFVWTPDGPFDTPAANPPAATDVLANQGPGGSATAKNNEVAPRPHDAGGSGQNANGEAAQIEQSARPLQLGSAQRDAMRAYFAGRPADRIQSANFSLSVGAAVPRDVPLQSLPSEVSSAMGGYKGDQYVLVGDQLVIVDPDARRVVAIVPGVG